MSRGGAVDRAPQPFAEIHAIRGRPREVAALVSGLVDRLGAVGFAAEEDHGEQHARRQRSPLRLIRLQRDDEQLMLVVADAQKPHRLHVPDQYELVLSGAVREREAVHAVTAALPFTVLEIESIARDMPLTASLPERAGDWLPSLELDASPLAGHGAIFTIHHQTDFVLLLQKALELGVERALVTVIDKEYRYRYSRRVDAHIREELGVPVYSYTDLVEGIEDHIRRIDAARAQNAARTWTPTLVIDDGGWTAPACGGSKATAPS
jgi:hypothetical protein